MIDNKKYNDFILKINIDKNLIFENYKENTKSIKSIFKKIYFLYTGIKLNKCNLEYIYLFQPLPRYFKIVNNNYNYDEKTKKNFSNCNSSNTILVGNVILPHHTISPIPFLFQYKLKNKFIYNITNVFYYELEIDKISSKEYFETESISIGFGCINTPINHNYVGWSNNTIGYHSDDGIIYADNTMIGKSDTFSNGDTVGAGIIYLTKNLYSIFFTLNGKYISLHKILKTNKKLTIMMNIDHSAGIYCNFGEKNFKYDFRELSSSNIISVKNKFIDKFILKDYEFKVNNNNFNFKKTLLMPLLSDI